MSSDQQLALARATTGQSTHLSKTARQVVPPFLQKLYEIVNDPKNDELIRWSESGDSFYVLNHERFAREVLGRWFKHQKFTSFVRQLNMYGFHKIPHLQQGVLRSDTDTEPWHFEHPHFHRGQPDLLCLIQRKKQPQQSNVDDMHIDMHEATAHITPQLANLSQGQILDINSVINGIAAIKRHQQAISADLNELKNSNQHLWQEALAARERHKKHQDTINRILKFLAGVFGQGAEHKHEGSPDSIQRKRPRLMIGDVTTNEKRKAATVEEVVDDDDKRSVSTPTATFATLDEPIVHSPSVAPSETYSPPASDTSTTNYRTTTSPPRTQMNESTTPNPSNNGHISPPEAPAAQNQNGPPRSLSPQSMSSALAMQNMPPNASTPEMWATLQQMLSTPNQMQRLMQALANQQQYPMPPMSEPGNLQYPVDSNTMNAVGPYGAQSHDWSRFPYGPTNVTTNGNLPFPVATAQLQHPPIPPLPQAPLTRRDSDDALGPLLNNAELLHSAEQLHKAYQDASQIDADVDALQFSINSLIENLGLDPTAITTISEDAAHQATGGGAPTGGDTPPTSIDFDFDAFFNELSSRPMPADYSDMVDSGGTTRFDPVASIDPSGVDDAQQEQLTAFLEDAGNSPLMDKHSAIPNTSTTTTTTPEMGKKRKSDVDLPTPFILNEDSPKAKRRR
ncbi:unnamed protein product [Somion occarium]|uniref:HSF-type DNA-binding domain-containing protein n=1 Tax=Somion occarium TaxID=3059160 RepID=A0ABP1DCF2_9APHY